MNLRIVSAHSSAVEIVASFTVNDPGRCFSILRKTIQPIQSLKKESRERIGDFHQKKRSKIEAVIGNMILKEGEKRILLHEKLKDLLPPNVWAMWIRSLWEGSI